MKRRNHRRLARHEASAIYERGWREGYQTALRKVQETSIDEVLLKERRLDDDKQLVIQLPEVH